MKNPMVKVALKYGLIGSIVSLIPFFVLLFTDKFSINSVSYIFIQVILVGVFIFFAIKEFKRYYNEGILHFWQGMNIGFIVYFSIAAVSAAVFWTTINQQDEQFLQEQITKRLESTEKTKLSDKNQIISEEAYQEGVEAIKNMTLADMGEDVGKKAFFINLFFGFVLTVVHSMILRKTSR